MFQSLRSRLILASLLWTGGLLLLMHVGSMLLVHTVPMPRGAKATIPVVVGVAVMLAGLLSARAGIAPILRLRAKVLAVQNGRESKIDGKYPAEVQPLIDSVNDLLANREKAIQRAYATAGDLAHGLKTPLALLGREAESAHSAGNVQLAEALRELIQRMSNQVDYHLARARISASGPTAAARSEVAPCVDALVRTVSKLHAERTLMISASVPAELCVRVRPEDLEEILGNVLDNACKWSRGKVMLTAWPKDGNVVLTVEDDGPGLPSALRSAVLERGVRVDESAPGSGLGLSIVRDLTEHYGGELSLDVSSLGGLCAQISLPSA